MKAMVILLTFMSNAGMELNGIKWIRLGGRLDVDLNATALNPSLAIDKLGNPVISWHEYGGASGTTIPNVYVKRWNGTRWTRVGTALDVNVGNVARDSSLALDSFGNPVVTWVEEAPNSYKSNLYVKKYVP